jgi:hypothetical protein
MYSQSTNVEVYLANLLRAGINEPIPIFIIELVDASNNVVASQFTVLLQGQRIAQIEIIGF